MSTPEWPVVSIVTPSFNQGEFVEATIRSVLEQTYPHVEYLFVDGGSTDETMTIVERYRSRIHTVIHEPDRGQSDALNKGFQRASGHLIGWINSDDVLYPDCVARIVDRYRQTPDGAVYYGAWSDWLDRAGRVTGQRHIEIGSKHDLLHRRADLIQQGSFYPLDLVRQIGYLDEAAAYCMDLDLFLRLLDHGPIYALSGPALAGFRAWEETKTSTGGARFHDDIRRTLRRHGASRWSPAVRHETWYALKSRVKQALVRP